MKVTAAQLKEDDSRIYLTKDEMGPEAVVYVLVEISAALAHSAHMQSCRRYHGRAASAGSFLHTSLIKNCKG